MVIATETARHLYGCCVCRCLRFPSELGSSITELQDYAAEDGFDLDVLTVHGSFSITAKWITARRTNGNAHVILLRGWLALAQRLGLKPGMAVRLEAGQGMGERLRLTLLPQGAHLTLLRMSPASLQHMRGSWTCS